MDGPWEWFWRGYRWRETRFGVSGRKGSNCHSWPRQAFGGDLALPSRKGRRKRDGVFVGMSVKQKKRKNQHHQRKGKGMGWGNPAGEAGDQSCLS